MLSLPISRRLVVVTSIVAVLVALVAFTGRVTSAPPQQAVPLPGAVITVTPDEVMPGGTVKILGAGFVTGEQVAFEIVNVWTVPNWGRHNTALGEIVTTNEGGAFLISAKIPAQLAQGMAEARFVATVQATGDKGSVANAPLLIAKKLP